MATVVLVRLMKETYYSYFFCPYEPELEHERLRCRNWHAVTAEALYILRSWERKWWKGDTWGTTGRHVFEAFEGSGVNSEANRVMPANCSLLIFPWVTTIIWLKMFNNSNHLQKLTLYLKNLASLVFIARLLYDEPYWYSSRLYHNFILSHLKNSIGLLFQLLSVFYNKDWTRLVGRNAQASFLGHPVL